MAGLRIWGLGCLHAGVRRMTQSKTTKVECEVQNMDVSRVACSTSIGGVLRCEVQKGERERVVGVQADGMAHGFVSVTKRSE